MARDELRRAIERPAQRVGLSVEPELVDALLADVEGQPGALPLLSTALLELWIHRDGRRLALAAYARGGGVQGAVARLAEEAFVALEPAQQLEARRLFLRLSDEDDNGTVVRRRIGLDQPDAALVAQLTERRLLIVDDGAVEVAHEALLREWPRLRGWLDEDAHGRRLHRRLGDAARAWDADARDPGELYRGGRLGSAVEWAGDHDGELSATERAFLDAGRRASGRAQRRLRLVLAGVGSLLVAAVIAGVVAFDQRDQARGQATEAAAQRLGAQALAADELDRSLLLARQGVALDDSPQTRGNLLAALLKSPAAIGVVRGDGGELAALDLSTDGRTLAFIDREGTLSFLDTRTRRPLARPQELPGMIFDPTLSFDRDGTRLAVSGTQPVVIDARTHRVTTRLRTSAVVTQLRFSTDGRTLFAVVGTMAGSVGVQRFDASSGVPLGTPRALSRNLDVTLLVAHDGRRVVTSVGAGPTVVRDARTLRPLRSLHPGSVTAALSSDDRTVLLGGSDGSVRFLDLASGALRSGVGRHDGPVIRATFSDDARTAATAGTDNRVNVWDVVHGTILETLTGQRRQLTGLVLSHDGRTLYTSALDGTVLIWDLAGDRRLGRPFAIQTAPTSQAEPQLFLGYSEPLSYAMRADGRVLAIGNPDGTVSLIDVRTLRTRTRFKAVRDGPVVMLTYMPDGRLFAVGHNGSSAIVSSTGELGPRLEDILPLVPSFSADGRLMATTRMDGFVVLQPLAAGRPSGPSRTYNSSLGAWGAALSPDARTLAVTTTAGVEIVDVTTLRRRTLLAGSEAVRPAAQFSPDGRFLVGGSLDGWTRVWSTANWRVSRKLGTRAGSTPWLSITRDSRTLATGGTDGTLQLYDLRTQRAIGAPLPGLPNHPTAPLFTPDGAYLFAITDAGRAYRWDIRPSSWERHACAVAGRTLTRTEFSDALPGRAYEPACATIGHG